MDTCHRTLEIEAITGGAANAKAFAALPFTVRVAAIAAALGFEPKVRTSSYPSGGGTTYAGWAMPWGILTLEVGGYDAITGSTFTRLPYVERETPCLCSVCEARREAGRLAQAQMYGSPPGARQWPSEWHPAVAAAPVAPAPVAPAPFRVKRGRGGRRNRHASLLGSQPRDRPGGCESPARHQRAQFRVLKGEASWPTAPSRGITETRATSGGAGTPRPKWGSVSRSGRRAAGPRTTLASWRGGRAAARSPSTPAGSAPGAGGRGSLR